MTGGLALILGEVGQNFAAGMTGGVAYVFDQYGTLDARVNHESVELKAPTAGELAQIRALVQEHVDATQRDVYKRQVLQIETLYLDSHAIPITSPLAARCREPLR